MLAGLIDADALPSWKTTFSFVLGFVSTGWNGFNLRQVTDSSRLLFSGSKVRCTFQAASTSGFTIDHAEIGHAAAAGDPYDFDGGQIPLTFSGGAAGCVVTVGNTILSDEMIFALDKTKNFIIAVHFSAASQIAVNGSAGAGVTAYFKSAADETATSDVTGYSTTATTVDLVNRIEVFV